MSIKSWIRKLVDEPVPTKVAPEVLPVNGTVGLPEVKNEPPMPPVVSKKPRKPRKPKVTTPPPPAPPPENPEKVAATSKGEPWVNVTGFDLDLDNLGSGNFDLDWNEIFVARLIKAGYVGKSDIDIVDQWFKQICRNIIEENFEQFNADPTNRNQ